ncbi:MAG TPA: hypothetical protein DIW77_13210 [Chromatiaceae bacterium]|jgi:flagellar motor switch protein FliM|nr:hypothetical protein [Chromatiaceae bacterium]
MEYANIENRTLSQNDIDQLTNVLDTYENMPEQPCTYPLSCGLRGKKSASGVSNRTIQSLGEMNLFHRVKLDTSGVPQRAKIAF